MVKKEKNTENLLKELEIKKEDLVEEIKKDIKENLFEEIENKVDYESKNKLEKMEKKIYKYKNRAILKRNILILIFLGIIIYETKILYDNNLLFGLTKKEETIEVKEEIEENKDNDIQEENKEEVIIEKDSEWYIENYSYLLDNIKTNLSGEDEYYLYEKDYTKETIRNNIKLNMAYQLLEEEALNNIIEVKEEDLKNAYKKIFGDIDNYKAENFNDNCIQFIYNKESKKYMAIDTDCEESNEKLYRDIKDIYEEDDKLIIETFVGLISEDKKTLSTIDKKETYDYSKDSISKLPVYKFIFEKIENEYYLYKIKQ